MKTHIKLNNLELNVTIGEYCCGSVFRHRHFLNLECEVDQKLVTIKSDSMDHVFDYDPLIRAIKEVSDGKTYKTQEKLVTLLLETCTKYPEISSVKLFLSKSPILDGTGTLGIEAILDQADLNRFRGKEKA